MSEEVNFRYFNKNNGHVAAYPNRHPRLEFLQNWVTVEDDNHLADLQAANDGTRSGRGNLLGSSNVGDRVEERHQVQESTLSTTIGTPSGDPDPVDPDPVDPEADTDPKDPEVVIEPDPVDPTPDPVPTPLDPADRPARSATKAEWVDWAVKAGASRDEAESMTKTDLIEVYGE